jgi:hypothetical protein
VHLGEQLLDAGVDALVVIEEKHLDAHERGVRARVLCAGRSEVLGHEITGT